MPSRRYVQGWGALSLAVGAVLVTTAAAQDPAPGRAAVAAARGPALLTVGTCSVTGGLCRVPRTTVSLDAPAPVELPGVATGPVDLALRTPGRLTDVTVTDRRGRRIAGRAGGDGTRWTSDVPLPAGGAYTARLVLEEDRPGGPPPGRAGRCTRLRRAAGRRWSSGCRHRRRGPRSGAPGGR